ncbi:PAS domain-containing sensor histidine kinase [Mucilaginibacter terrae]|nr:PAS domain-containing sensor histidine kinase [Mucilaginibacter terrae]
MNQDPVLRDGSAALWEFNMRTSQLKGSAGFYDQLNYEIVEKEMDYHYFINTIVYHEDLPLLLKVAASCEPGSSKSLELRLLTGSGFQWFQNTFRREEGPVLTGYLINIHQFKIVEFELADANQKHAALGKIFRSGIWEIDVQHRSITFSKEACEVLQTPGQAIMPIAEWISHFTPAYRPVLTNSINYSIEIGKAFDHDLQFRTGTGLLIWVRIKGLTKIDKWGKILFVKGAVQNIDHSKKQEKQLLSSFEFLELQNKRLQNFAYMVSHNLRSHTSNLKYLVQMHKESNEDGEKSEIFDHISTISDSLNTTIQHLNEIVKMEADVKQKRVLLHFETVYRNVVMALESNIDQEKAVILADFSACPSIEYIPAYLESIFHNFITNALKYRHPDRSPEIRCYSKIADEYICLYFEDNGVGIDLNRYGHKLFGINQTFHQHADAKGIGLFITRNQVEALGGNIEVQSTVGEGTQFCLRLVKYIV